MARGHHSTEETEGLKGKVAVDGLLRCLEEKRETKARQDQSKESNDREG